MCNNTRMERGRRALVADDHGPTLADLARHLRWAGFEVAAECRDGATAVVETVRLQPDLCVLDVHMPGMSGIEAAASISKRLPDVRIVLVTASPIGSSDVDAAVRAGVHGFVPKDRDADDLVTVLRRVAAGATAFLTGHGLADCDAV